jgi:GNAT superfamily N-acetyltransferase
VAGLPPRDGPQSPVIDRDGNILPPVRRLGPHDLPSCVALALDRGWLPEERKWALLLRAAEGYGVDAPDGGLAGAVVFARYGTVLASVGMMLVAARFGRRGLGRALLVHLLDEAGEASVFLTATTYGRPLYQKLGFRAVGRSATFTGRFRDEAGRPATRPAVTADLPAIIDVDKAAFGADRGPYLAELPEFTTQLRVLEADGRIAGYAGAWPNGNGTVIGPVVAPDDARARLLVGDLAANVAGPIRLDLDPDRRELPRWVTAHGLRYTAETTFMVRGAWPPPGRSDRIYAPITVALS